MDREKIGMINASNSASASATDSNPKIITKLRELQSIGNGEIGVSRIADGVSSRHVIVITRNYKAYGMGSNQKGQLGLGHYKSITHFEEIEFKKTQFDTENYIEFDCIDASAGDSHSAFVVMPRCSLPVLKILNYYFMRYHLYRTSTYPAIVRLDEIFKLIFQFTIKSQSLINKEARGRLYVCGLNSFGQLGLGNQVKQCINTARQVTESGLAAVSMAQVSCGENHTICLDNRGRVYCFGDNYYGQSAAHLNHYENVYYPLKVEHFKEHFAARIVKVSSGKYHCLALDKLGRVFSWGLGAYGQLGCNKLNKRCILPIQVEALQNDKVIDIRCGIYHSIAVTNTARLFCWGSNNYGQCLQNVNNNENVITPQAAKLDYFEQRNLSIYKVFSGYYSTLIIAHEASS